MRSRVGVGPARLLVLVAAGLLSGCDADPMLVVEVRTDFVPGVEFTRVETRSSGGLELGVDAADGDDFVGGVRLGEAVFREQGTRLTTTLFDRSGAVVATRDVALGAIERSTRIVILVSRRCSGVDCNAAGGQACLRGACAADGCLSGNEASCPTPECVSDVDCPAPSECAVGICLAGTCLARLSDTCSADQRCHPTDGCVPRDETSPDAGISDAGAPDAGRPDAGAPDAGPPDAGPPDAGAPDAGAPGPWGTVTPVAELAPPDGEDDDVTLTDDMLHMWFNSTRTAGIGSFDIWYTSRERVTDPWSPPQLDLELSSTGFDGTPEVRGDGLLIFWLSNRDGQRHFYSATRASTTDAWSTPRQHPELFAGGAVQQFDPTPFDGGLGLIFTSHRNPAAMGNGTLFVATRASLADPFGPATQLDALASLLGDGGAFPRDDVLYFSSRRLGQLDIFVATRVGTDPVWDTPMIVDELSSPGGDSDPWLSADHRTVYLVRGGQIHIATR